MTYSYLVLSLCLVWSADDKAPAAAPAIAPPADSERILKLLQNPDDARLLSSYVQEFQAELYRLTVDKPEAAAVSLAAFEGVLRRLTPRTEAVKLSIERERAALPEYRERIEAALAPLAELEAKALAAPDDLALFRKWAIKLGDSIVGLAYSRPDDAQKMLAAGNAFCGRMEQATHNEQVKQYASGIANLRGSWTLQRSMIDEGLRFASLAGQPADPLTVKSWASGEPTTLAGLRGRVVLICSFPVTEDSWTEVFALLQAWQARYESRGLTIIGVASNRGKRWNDVTQALDQGRRPGEPRAEFTLEQEHETLRKFVAFHGLKIPLATHDPRGREGNLDLKGNAGLVLIDQQGKIRAIRKLPHFQRNAEDIDRGLAELLPATK